MIKPTKRKAFNFLRSYFDVLNELEKDEDKLNFLLSIINKQFLNENPKELNFVVNLCYESQRHAIESSVKGWIRVNKDTLLTNPPSNPLSNPMTNPKEEEENWFNSRREKYLEKASNINRMSYQDKKNLDELKLAYPKEDFEKVMINLCNNKYANENKRIIPSHFLEYFENYVGEEPQPIISKNSKTMKGWALC